MPSVVAFRFGEAGADPAHTVFVDGTTDGFRSLSHWPGNTTPAPFKRDLSTQICLAWAAASPSERAELLGDFNEVANNHFDTDGVLSVFAVLFPEIALQHRDLMERAAATGDFGIWTGADALALELTIMSITQHPQSPLAPRCATLKSNAARWELGYRWLLGELPALLDNPYSLAGLWSKQHERICREVAAIDGGSGPTVERHPALDLAVITSPDDLTAIALHHAAGELYRVLLIQPVVQPVFQLSVQPQRPDQAAAGLWRYRFCYRDESWFDTVHIRAQPRVDLDDALVQLRRRELAAFNSSPNDNSPGGTPAPANWWVGELAAPIVELRHSANNSGGGFGSDPTLSQDPPSRLAPAEVIDILVRCLSP
ncbi:MAG: hypothetical protein ACI9EF_000935 [Pseudohongiellaceae bacterium]|jgi:hypothetical protein